MATAAICIIASLTVTASQAYADAQLPPGAVLYAGQCLKADQGRFQLCMQGDGNLVLNYYGTAGWVPAWATNTYGHPGTRLQTQYDGNVVLVAPGERPIWATGTDRHPGSKIQVQDDGNVVVYDASLHPIWASNTDWAVTPGVADTGAWKILSADHSVPVLQYRNSCLDMDINPAHQDPKRSNMSPTQAWQCNTFQNQVWYFVSAGAGNWVYLQNAKNFSCLTADYTRAPSGGNGTPLTAETCVNDHNDPKWLRQMWVQERVTYPGWPNGQWWRLKNGRQPNMCATIDKRDGAVHNGSHMILSDCLPGFNQIQQQWRVAGKDV